MSTESSVLLTPDCKVAQNFRLKNDLLKEGDPEHQTIKTGLFINGGIMLGAFSGGVVTGLEEVGMSEVVDWGLGESAGGAALAYFLARQSALGTSIYYEELSRNGFINFMRLERMIDIDLLVDVFRGKRGCKRLDLDVLKSSRSNLMIAVTDILDGQARYIDIKDSQIDPMTYYMQELPCQLSITGIKN